MDAANPVSGEATGTITFLGVTLQPRSLKELNMLVEQGFATTGSGLSRTITCIACTSFIGMPNCVNFMRAPTGLISTVCRLVALGVSTVIHSYASNGDPYDWTYPLMELAASKGWRVFHVGSSRGSSEKGAARLRKLYPALQLEVSEGYFDARYGSSENEALVQRINGYGLTC